jgi:hypothetical protein
MGELCVVELDSSACPDRNARRKRQRALPLLPVSCRVVSSREALRDAIGKMLPDKIEIGPLLRD